MNSDRATRMLRTARLGIILAAFTGCGVRNGGNPLEQWRLEGQITYRERIALPPDAIAYVHLVEGGREGSPPVAEDRVAPAGQVPVRFSLEYAPASIDTARAYALRARIEDGTGRVLFETPGSIPVEPWSARTVEILLSPPQQTAAAEPAADPWERARAAGADMRGLGQEPGWTVEVHEGERIVLVTEYGARTETFAAPRRAVLPNGGERYTANGERGVELTIEETACSDTMSGEQFPLTITVVVAADTLRGCGRRLN